jgi:hypothetical protein
MSHYIGARFWVGIVCAFTLGVVLGAMTIIVIAAILTAITSYAG